MKRTLIASFLLLCTSIATAQNSDKGVKLNYGIKAGFQAVTYNHIEFDIEGYKFNNNTIQSNKIGYTISPFMRVAKGNFYIQTEAVFGITRYHFDFYETGENATTPPTKAEYNLATYCFQVPLLFGYNFIHYENYGMSVFTGPRTKFILTSLSSQKFSHFKYDELFEELEKRLYYWEIGLGVRINNVFLDITYDWGINTNETEIINKEKGNVYKNKRNDSILSFSVGFIF